MVKPLVMAGLIGVSVVAAGAPARGQGAEGAEPFPRVGARIGPLALPVGVPTAPREDGAKLPFPVSLLQRDGQFGIDPRMMALPLGVLALMVVLGIVTFRVAFRE
jgi:hypothetical protein